MHRHITLIPSLPLLEAPLCKIGRAILSSVACCDVMYMKVTLHGICSQHCSIIPLHALPYISVSSACLEGCLAYWKFLFLYLRQPQLVSSENLPCHLNSHPAVSAAPGPTCSANLTGFVPELFYCFVCFSVSVDS